jgi:hypothetical protein
MYRSIHSAPADGRWLWIYGVLLPMCEDPTDQDDYDWHRARWVAPTETDAGDIVEGYWEFGFEDLWVRNPLAWMAPPPAPRQRGLLSRQVKCRKASQSPNIVKLTAPRMPWGR